MGTGGHSLSVHADTKQGTPSAAAEGESTEAEVELNRHGNEWLKAMNRDRIHSQVRQSQRDREPRETEEPES